MIRNKKADLEYDFEYQIESGLVLKADEVRSIRKSSPSIKEAYGTIIKGELFLKNFTLNKALNSDRMKKLLLHKKQIYKIIGLLSTRKSNVIIIREFYEINGKFKVLIGVGNKTKEYDQREKIKLKEMSKSMKNNLEY